MEPKNKPRKILTKMEQTKIVKKTFTGGIHDAIGHPKQMSGVTLNLITGKYE